MNIQSIDDKRKYVGRINRLTRPDGPGASYLQLIRRKRFIEEIAAFEKTQRHPADIEASMLKNWMAGHTHITTVKTT